MRTIPGSTSNAEDLRSKGKQATQRGELPQENHQHMKAPMKAISHEEANRGTRLSHKERPSARRSQTRGQQYHEQRDKAEASKSMAAWLQCNCTTYTRAQGSGFGRPPWDSPTGIARKAGGYCQCKSEFL